MRSFQFEIFPDAIQKQAILFHLEICQELATLLEMKRISNFYALSKTLTQIKKEKKTLKFVHSNPLQQVAFQVSQNLCCSTKRDITYTYYKYPGIKSLSNGVTIPRLGFIETKNVAFPSVDFLQKYEVTITHKNNQFFIIVQG
jgi:hypothetical protein